jgi:hypothetical protein
MNEVIQAAIYIKNPCEQADFHGNGARQQNNGPFYMRLS